MRKALLGPFHLGVLSGLTNAMEIAERVSGERGCDMEGLFFATAFQTGIDRFVMHEHKGIQKPRSDFVRARTEVLEAERFKANWIAVRKGFSKHLPGGWERDDKYSNLWAWSAFLVDLLDAMDRGASLLAVGGVPDTSDIETLAPTELLVPLHNLAAAFEPASAPSTVPAIAVVKDNVDRFQAILTSDVFAGYVGAEEGLEDATSAVPGVLENILISARAVVKRNPQLLAVRRSGIAVLSFTPKLVEAAFGKLPGAIADVAAKLGVTYLDARRRVVVYDFQKLMLDALLLNFVRMFRASDARATTVQSSSNDDS